MCLPVNIVAPYLLTALIDRPQRLVYLSSGAHRSGRARLQGVDWSGVLGRVRVFARPVGRVPPVAVLACIIKAWRRRTGGISEP
jgi:hypothetical protein